MTGIIPESSWRRLNRSLPPHSAQTPAKHVRRKDGRHQLMNCASVLLLLGSHWLLDLGLVFDCSLRISPPPRYRAFVAFIPEATSALPPYAGPLLPGIYHRILFLIGVLAGGKLANILEGLEQSLSM